MYYVYENWQAGPHKAVIHVARCSFCNAGKGRAGGYNPGHARWHEAGNRLENAHAISQSLHGVKNISECSFCIR